jgi:hypothetical protein
MLGSIVLFVASAVMLVLYVWSIAWAYGDAESRGKPGCLVALLVMLLSWPLGLILWIVFRPENGRRRY